MVLRGVTSARACLAVAILLALHLTAGCGPGGPPTPAQAFNAAHGGKTVTPYGRVVENSAVDLDEGYVQYRTEDGRKWKVLPVGSSETPEEVP